VLGGVVPGRERRPEIVEVPDQRPLAVLVERVDGAGLAHLGLADQFGEHDLGGGLVGRQAHRLAVDPAVPVGRRDAAAAAAGGEWRDDGLAAGVLVANGRNLLAVLALDGDALGAVGDGTSVLLAVDTGHGHAPS
jgi:hypothetical protein